MPVEGAWTVAAAPLMPVYGAVTVAAPKAMLGAVVARPPRPAVVVITAEVGMVMGRATVVTFGTAPVQVGISGVLGVEIHPGGRC